MKKKIIHKSENNQLEIIKWTTWFFAGNILLFWLIGLKFLPNLQWLFQNEYLTILSSIDRFTLLVYLAFAYLGYLAALAFIPFVFTLILTIIFSNRLFIMSVSIILATINLGLFISDTVVYNLFHFHINSIILELVVNSAKNEQNMLNLSDLEIALCIGAVFVVLISEFLFALWVEKWDAGRHKDNHPHHKNKHPKNKNLGVYFITFTILCLFIAYSIFLPTAFSLYRGGAWVDRSFGHALIEASRILPYFNKTLGFLLPAENGQIALERVFEHKFVQPSQASNPLNYPLTDLKFKSSQKPLNLVVIVIDAWRFDMLKADVTPTLYEFSKKAWVFNQHFSGGNSTGPGIFSLFYGLPATYWTAMQDQRKGPVLIDELLKENYQTNILASAGLLLPNLKGTVFQNIKNATATIPGNDPYERDVNITEKFKIFIQDREVSSPFFSFLFYASSHSYCQITNDLTPFTPSVATCNRFNLTNKTDPIPYLNRYKNSLLLVDNLIKQVFETLSEHHLLDSTVVIITGDHGEEFNDNKLGYFGHTSNFTRFQLQTPLIVHWPGEAHKNIYYQTSHYDICPTLMEKLLGCQSGADTYSIGHSLLENKPMPYYLVGSYIGFGVVETHKNQIITIYPGGDFQITKLNGQPIEEATPDPTALEKTLEFLRKFYQK